MGIANKHLNQIEIDLHELQTKDALAICYGAVLDLGWEVLSLSDIGIQAKTTMSGSSWSEHINISVEDGLLKMCSSNTQGQLINYGQNKRNTNAFLDNFKSLTKAADTMGMEELRAAYEQALQNNELSQEIAIPETSRSSVLDFFKPVDGYFVTPILILLNVLLFVAMVISGVHFINPDGQSLLDWGANYRALTISGQWWRLFTACFLHIGIVHLLFNMYALLYIGVLLEPILGRTKFLAAYLLSGIAASLASLAWHENTISAGASGAIFGMYGVFLALLLLKYLDKSSRSAFLTSIGIFVLYNIVYGLRPDSGIDNAAHIGGLISGLLIGYAFIPSLKQENNTRLQWIGIAALCAALCIASVLVYSTLPRDIAEYSKKMEQFALLEEKALNVFNAQDDQAMLQEIKSSGIANWHEAKGVLNQMSELDVSEELQRRNAKLLEYCELRIRSYELIAKAIESNSDMYTTEIQKIDAKIGALIEELTE